jgi:hypothetical protein
LSVTPPPPMVALSLFDGSTKSPVAFFLKGD